MYRIDLSESPDILELGLLAAADPTFLENIFATMVDSGEAEAKIVEIPAE